jgi:hypothetical protein
MIAGEEVLFRIGEEQHVGEHADPVAAGNPE